MLPEVGSTAEVEVALATTSTLSPLPLAQFTVVLLDVVPEKEPIVACVVAVCNLQLY